MYNFLVAYGEDAWDKGTYEFAGSRFAVEYTEDSISERYRDLPDDVVEELQSFPALFCVEGEIAPTRLGYITSIRKKDRVVTIEYRFETSIPPLPPEFVSSAPNTFELGRFEMTRTHWAIKEGDLWSILESYGLDCSHLRPSTQTSLSQAQEILEAIPITNKERPDRVFIVHGHDDVVKYEMAEAIRSLGYEPVILHEQANGGLTIIEKIEKYSDVGFAVVLYTPCDIGGKRAIEISLSPRARQNVVFEHGYLMAKLGRNKVMAFVKGKVETPTDISGVLYIELDQNSLWKKELIKEMRAAGYDPIS